jgi:RHS repeat-associated protein
MSSFTYDRDGRQLTKTTTRTTPAGPETLTSRYSYDALGREEQQTDPDGTTTQTSYDPLDKVLETVDKLGRRTRHTYDEMGRLLKTEYPDGTAVHNTYDPEGRRLTTRDRGGRTIRYEYDAVGRLAKTTYPDDSMVTSAYDGAGQLIESVDSRGNQTKYSYDAAGRRTRIQDALGNENIYAYDAVANQIGTTDAKGETTTFEFDDADRLVLARLPDGTSEAIAYDRVGRKISTTDAAGKTTKYVYDKLGQVTNVIVAMSQTSTYAYDEYGNRIAETDVNGHTSRFEYDKLGRETRRTLPLGASERRTYDAAGNLLQRIDFRGAKTTYTYDLNDRVLSRSYPDGTAVSFTYTPSGQRATVTDARGVTSYEYDSRDRAVKITDPSGRVLTYEYDREGNRLSLKMRAGTTELVTSYEYDSLNRLEKVIDPGGRLYSYSYDPNSNQAALRYPNGIVTTRSYDRQNQLTDLVSRASTGSILQSYSYVLDAAGHRARVTEAGGVVRDYERDAAYRLTREQVSRSASPVYEGRFALDRAGNRLSLQEVDVGGAVTTTTYGYDDRDRLVSAGSRVFAWDDNGNLSHGTSTRIASARWDFENRLIEVILADGTKVSHGYDVDGNRVRTEVTPEGGASGVTEYLVDPSQQLASGRAAAAISQVVAEFDGSGSLSAYYVRGDELLAVTRPSGSRFFHSDGLGTVRLLTDTDQGVTDTYSFTAFGTPLSRAGSDVNPYLFAGELFEPTTGLYFLRARWLDPEVGRFLSSDPMPADPLSIDRSPYAYASGDPVDFVDPRGLYTQSFGYAVEDEIEDQYSATHPGDVVTYGKWARVGKNFRLKPDILNHSKALFNEIKPLSFLGIAGGVARMGIYLASLEDYSPDMVWRPPFQPIYPQGVPTFVNNVQGILFYSDNAEIVNEFFMVVVTSQLYELLRNPKAFTTALDELAAIRRLVAVSSSVNSAELENEVGTATTLSVYGGGFI